MKRNIIERVKLECDHIIKTENTIREVAKVFGVSKSTVHKDLSSRLKNIDEKKYKRVSEILQYHIDVRHIRGGESTRKRFKRKSVN